MFDFSLLLEKETIKAFGLLLEIQLYVLEYLRLHLM